MSSFQQSRLDSTQRPVSPDPLECRRGFRDESERRAVLEWLGRGLRPARPSSLVDEYPLVLDTSGKEVEHITLWEKAQPVAHAVVREETVHLRDHPLRVGMISLVYTAPSARGRGLATRVLCETLECARERELGLCMLWTKEERLYGRLGFEPAGSEQLLVLNSQVVEQAIAACDSSEASLPQVGPMAMDEWEAIQALRAARSSYLDRSALQLARLQRIPNLQMRVARRDGVLSGFAIRGRGDDLEEVIHEWGGDPESVLVCCRDLLSSERNDPQRELFLLAPAERTDVSWKLRQAGARLIRQPLAWMKIAHLEAFEADLHRALPGLVRTRLSESPESQGQLTLTRGHATQSILPCDFLRTLFGYSQSGDAHELDEVLGQSAAVELPLPLFVSGLESI